MESRDQISTQVMLLKQQQAFNFDKEQYQFAALQDEAILDLFKTIPEKELTLEDRWEIQAAHYRLGLCYENQSEDDNCVQEYQNAISQLLILKKNNNYLTKSLLPLAKYQLNIGDVISDSNQLKTALEAYEIGLQYLMEFEKHEGKTVEQKKILDSIYQGMANTYSDMANNYLGNKNEIKIKYYKLAIETRKIILKDNQNRDLLTYQYEDHQNLVTIFDSNNDLLLCFKHNIAAINCLSQLQLKTKLDFVNIKNIYGRMQHLYQYSKYKNFQNYHPESPEFIFFNFAYQVFSGHSKSGYFKFKEVQYHVSTRLNMQTNMHLIESWFQFLKLLRDTCKLDTFPKGGFKTDMRNKKNFKEFKEFVDKLNQPQQKLMDIIANKESFALSVACTLDEMDGKISALESKIGALEEAQRKSKRKHDDITDDEPEEKQVYVLSTNPNSTFKQRKITEFLTSEDKTHTFIDTPTLK